MHQRDFGFSTLDRLAWAALPTHAFVPKAASFLLVECGGTGVVDYAAGVVEIELPGQAVPRSVMIEDFFEQVGHAPSQRANLGVLLPEEMQRQDRIRWRRLCSRRGWCA